MAYVDDVKLAAPGRHMKRLWSDLRQSIRVDDTTPPDRYLRCYAKSFSVPRPRNLCPARHNVSL